MFSSFLRWLNIVTHRLNIVLNNYPWELRTYVHIRMYTEMLTALLHIRAKKWKWHKCPSTGEWKSMVYPTMEYDLTITRKKVLICASMQVKLGNSMLKHSKRAMWGHSKVAQRGLLGETKSAGTLISNSSFQKYEKVNFKTKQEHYTKWKKLVIKSHILYDSIYINVQNRQIHGDRK